jgi:hypothetical protein
MCHGHTGVRYQNTPNPKSVCTSQVTLSLPLMFKIYTLVHFNINKYFCYIYIYIYIPFFENFTIE